MYSSSAVSCEIWRTLFLSSCRISVLSWPASRPSYCFPAIAAALSRIGLCCLCTAVGMPLSYVESPLISLIVVNRVVHCILEGFNHFRCKIFFSHFSTHMHSLWVPCRIFSANWAAAIYSRISRDCRCWKLVTLSPDMPCLRPFRSVRTSASSRACKYP